MRDRNKPAHPASHSHGWERSLYLGASWEEVKGWRKCGKDSGVEGRVGRQGEAHVPDTRGAL